MKTTTIELLGAGGFGALVGWYVYFINRHRKDQVQLSDLVTLIGVLGGGAILKLFPSGTALFGAYGIGLFVGFYAYLLVLAILVNISKNFNVDWFLDGRRKVMAKDEYRPGEGEGGGGNPMATEVRRDTPMDRGEAPLESTR